jgi:hypothetical protein
MDPNKSWDVKVPGPRIDWPALRDRIDLGTLATSFLGPAPGRRGGKGSRLWWSCPFHRDPNPSFAVATRRRWFKCFGCGEQGDAATLVMKLIGVTFPEAVRWLDERYGTGSSTTRPPPVPTAKAPAAGAASRLAASPGGPSGLSPDAATALVEAASERLWTPRGKGHLDYLRSRGLEDETIRTARLGAVERAWIPTKDGDRTFPVSGVSIPWFDGGAPVKVNIRDPDAPPERRYKEAFRDRPVLYPGRAVLESGRPVIVAEGELDCLLLAQQLPEACVVTLGSASAKPDPDVLALLLFSAPWFVALDADPAGDRAAADWPASAIRVRPPDPDKDWGEVHARGPNRVRYSWGRLLNHSLPWEGLEPKGDLS